MNFLFLFMSIFAIPKEICISILNFDTIKSFCSSCTSFWNEKEIIAQDMILHYLYNVNVNVESFIFSIKETKDFPLTYYKFANLFMNETYFHLLDPFFKCAWDNVIITDLYKCKISTCYGFTSLSLLKENDVLIKYLTSHPRVTFCYKYDTNTRVEEFDKLDNIPSLFWTRSNKTNKLTNYTYDSVIFTRNLLLDIRNTVIYKNSADCVLGFLKEGFFIFPSPKKLSDNKNLLESYKLFFRLIFNNKKVVGKYFNKLRKQMRDNTLYKRDAYRFLYFVKYYGYVMDFAFRELQKHKNDATLFEHLHYVTRQHFRHEDAI
jgi:hypothetical protein